MKLKNLFAAKNIEVTMQAVITSARQGDAAGVRALVRKCPEAGVYALPFVEKKAEAQCIISCPEVGGYLQQPGRALTVLDNAVRFNHVETAGLLLAIADGAASTSEEKARLAFIKTNLLKNILIDGDESRTAMARFLAANGADVEQAKIAAETMNGQERQRLERREACLKAMLEPPAPKPPGPLRL